MADLDLARQRLYIQHIAGPPLSTPREVVAWMGAMQGQEYPGAVWAIGLRMPQATEADVAQAIADKSIVRTWFMRGTLHFVPGADLRWMLALMAPRMRRLIENTSSYNQLELDEAVFARSRDVLMQALRGGRQRMRTELSAALEQAGIAAAGLRFSLIMQRAQADGLICYGPRQGKQATFVLLEEWVPPAPALEGEAALAEFSRRYFRSHGPATVRDFMWWSGFNAADARAGLELVKPQLISTVIAGQTYWHDPSAAVVTKESPTIYLLPTYDELIVGYKDRSALFTVPLPKPDDPRDNIVFNPTIIRDGRLIGTWKRTLKAKSVVIDANPLAPMSEEEARAFTVAAARYAAFVNLRVAR